MNETTMTPSPSVSAEQVELDETRIRSGLAGTDGGVDPFVAAVRATRMPMIITDPRQPDNPIAFVNDAFCKLTGYAREEILGHNCRFLQGPETDPADVAKLREAIAAPRPIELDIRNHKKDGTPFWNRLLVAPVHDASGQLAYFFSSQFDVTIERERLVALEDENATLAAEREANQARLKTSEATLRLAIEAAEVGTWDLDLITDVLTWSDRTKAMFGISPDVPCSMADFYGGLHLDDREATSAAFASALDPVRRATYNVEYRTIGKEDGIVRWVAAKGRGLFDEAGRCVRAIGTAIDITARREAEARLHFVVGLSDLLQTASSPLDVKMSAAQALGQHLGADRTGYGEIVANGEVISVERDWTMEGVPSLDGEARVLDAFGPQVIAELRQGRTLVVEDCETDPRTCEPAYLATWRSIGTRSLVVVPLVRGGEFSAALYVHSAAPRAWTPGEVGLAEEVASRTWSAHVQAQAEEALRALNATLEERVQERTAELERTYDALRQSQKMEAVGQLTGGIAHDFNNLLAGISGSLELMQTRMSQGRLKDIDRYLTAAQGAAKRAAALTHRLLAFSRRQTLDPKPTNVNALIHGMEELIRRTVGPAIEVEVVGASGLWPTLVDPSQLENALLNLCINARDAMPDGGRITIETANKWLDRWAAQKHEVPEGQYLSLCVTDTGTGMTPDIVAKAFDPFFTTKPIGQGTGLGLSMIYGFAKQSGGQVRIYSEVGQGTTVCIYLPRYHGAVAEDDPLARLEDAPRAEQGETVLVVDDEPTVRMLVTEVLEELGYAAIEAADAASGLKVLQSDARIDLLVTDVGLPGGMNGRQMADAARVSRPELKVLFITGYAENAVVGNGHLEPGMAVLTKPFVVETLGVRIREMIAQN
ncbi:PAS domain S-box protein [Methylobacterium oxalidis]|uniref:PAS domain S-box protein n=1 Tax=Methylobacterium oxalidis TaxID=944322 RepID=UPI00331469E2